MIDKNSEKYLQFEKMWNGITPKGTNISKTNYFRSLMKNNCQQEGFEFSKINSYLVYSGEYKRIYFSPKTYLMNNTRSLINH